jgi:hypothetical protein
MIIFVWYRNTTLVLGYPSQYSINTGLLIYPFITFLFHGAI